MGKKVARPANPSQVQTRRTPQQDRAKDTVAKILDATAELLEESGHTKLTTTRVAKRSGLNVATVYHYFPNKLALLHALAKKFAEEQQERIDLIYARRAERDWRDTLDDVLDTILEFNRTVTGAVALSLAMRSYPTLRQIDHDRDVRESKLGAVRLAEVGVKGSPRELQFKALLLIEMATAMIDYALQLYPEEANVALDELKLMARLYIEHLIKQSAEDSSSGDTSR